MKFKSLAGVAALATAALLFIGADSVPHVAAVADHATAVAIDTVCTLGPSTASAAEPVRGEVIRQREDLTPTPDPISFADDETPDDKPDEPEPTSLEIDAPAAVKIGQLVEFVAAESAGQKFVWEVMPETPNFKVYENGRVAVFSGHAAGDYLIIVAAAQDDLPEIAVHKLQVVGDPQPDDPDNPEPESLDRKVTGWAKLVVSDTAKEEAGRLAGSFETVQSMIGAGALKDIDSILAATQTSNRKALGDSLDAWKPFLDSLGEELGVMSEAGTLLTPEDHDKAWGRIAEGLKAFAAGS